MTKNIVVLTGILSAKLPNLYVVRKSDIGTSYSLIDMYYLGIKNDCVCTGGVKLPRVAMSSRYRDRPAGRETPEGIWHQQ